MKVQGLIELSWKLELFGVSTGFYIWNYHEILVGYFVDILDLIGLEYFGLYVYSGGIFITVDYEMSVVSEMLQL